MPKYSRRKYKRGRKQTTYRRKPYLKAEVKRRVVTVGQTNVDATTGQVKLFNGLTEGPAIDERIGRRVQLLSLNLRGITEKSTANLDALIAIRYALALDMQPTAILPTCANFWDNTATTSKIIGCRNQVFVSRFRTLATWTVVVHGTEGNTGGETSMPWEKYIKINQPAMYDGTDNTYASLAKNALVLFMQGNKQTAGEEAETEICGVLRYKDP